MRFKLSAIILMTAVGALALTALQGCFTGIEHTATIKDTTSKSKNKPVMTDEQKLLKDVAPQFPALWKAGKPFIVTEGRLAYAYTPASEAAKLHTGDTLYFEAFRPGVRLAGDSVTEVVLNIPAHEQIHTTIESPLSKIMDAEVLTLPFTVDADLVGSVRDKLKGKTVWTIRKGRDGRKFQKTEIIDVLPGNADFPFKVVIPGDSMLMLLNSRSASARTFGNMFTLSDPRKRYPQISDKTWANICNGTIAVDMTREECRLALGAPAGIERDAAYNGIIERWTYEDGKYLVFVDGLLSTFRL